LIGPKVFYGEKDVYFILLGNPIGFIVL